MGGVSRCMKLREGDFRDSELRCVRHQNWLKSVSGGALSNFRREEAEEGRPKERKKKKQAGRTLKDQREFRDER